MDLLTVGVGREIRRGEEEGRGLVGRTIDRVAG